MTNNKKTSPSTRPVKQNGYSNNKLKEKRNRKRAEAEIRQLRYNNLPIEKKIALAKSRRGESKYEIEKLSKQL